MGYESDSHQLNHSDENEDYYSPIPSIGKYQISVTEEANKWVVGK